MVLRPLGSTEIRVSALGLGTVKFGRNHGVKYPRPFVLPSDAEVRDLLDLARDLGINLLDTAPAYGTSEERLGRLLNGRRQEWIITTKVGETFQDGESRFDFSAAATRESVERSLRRLATDWLDVVLIHSNGDDERILREEGVLETLLTLKQEGRVRAVGMSTKTVPGGRLAVECCDLVMVTYNALQRDELPVIHAAHDARKGILVKKGLVSGHLDRLPGTDPVENALRLIYAEPGISSVVVGTLNPSHLRANAEAADRVLAAPYPG